MAQASTAPSPEKTGTAVCPNCGGRVSYDIRSGCFRCESCRSEIEVETRKDTVDEYSIDQYRMHERRGKELTGVSTAYCQTCGGEIFFDEHETAKCCPMCGSAQIRTEAATSGIAPEGVVPFRIDREDAQQRFRKWIAKRWFAPQSPKEGVRRRRAGRALCSLLDL